MGMEKGYNSSYVYCHAKGWSKKIFKKISQWFWKGFLKWYDGEGENGITSKKIFEVEASFSSQNVNFLFIWGDFLSFSFSFSFSFSLFFSSISWGLRCFDGIWGENHFFKNFFSNGFNYSSFSLTVSQQGIHTRGYNNPGLVGSPWPRRGGL
jgi:hypothetical protein